MCSPATAWWQVWRALSTSPEAPLPERLSATHSAARRGLVRPVKWRGTSTRAQGWGSALPKTSQTAASVLEPYLATRIADVERLDPIVRAGDADAIHDMRVAARRLKSILAAYRSVFDSASARHLRAELDWLADVLGQARDPDVQRLILLELVDGDDRAEQVNAANRAMAADAQAALTMALASDRYRTLVKDLQIFSADPPWKPAAHRSARKTLLRALSTQFERVASRVAFAETTTSPARLDERLHRVRKSVKRARYATEAAGSVVGKGGDLVKALSAVQDTLGTHNDLVVTRANTLAWIDLGVNAIDGAVLGQLDAEAQKTRAEAQRTLDSLHKILARAASSFDVTLLR